MAVLGGQGTVYLSDRSQAQSMFDPLFTTLADQGFDRSVAERVLTRQLGDDVSLVDATFVRRRSDGSALERVATLYVCRRTNSGWRIVALIPHPPDSPALPA